MAGSYAHLFDGFSMIENLGDASEALHELLWLVERGVGRERALALLDREYYPMCRGERAEDPHFVYVTEMQQK